MNSLGSILPPPPCYDNRQCWILSFDWFLRVWILYADVSEQSVPSLLVGKARRPYTTNEDGTDRLFRNVGIQNSDGGKSPKRKNMTFRIGRKFEIKNRQYDCHKKNQGMKTTKSHYTAPHPSELYSSQCSPSERQSWRVQTLLILFHKLPFLELGWPSTAGESLSYIVQGSYWWPDSAGPHVLHRPFLTTALECVSETITNFRD
jgi:hypothetical protein